MSMELHRTAGWESRLNKLFSEKLQRTFDWKDNNCVFFVCDVVQTITGYDLGKEFRGEFDTEKEAYKQLKSLGHEDLKSLARYYLPTRDKSVTRRGDICLLQVPDTKRYLLGVVLFGCAYALSTNGMHKFTHDQIIEIYGVG